MAGQPRKRALLEELTRRARELGPDATTLDYVCQYVAGGGTLVGLTSEIEKQLGMDVARYAIQHHLAVTYGQSAKTALAAARKDSAHALAEEAKEIIEDAPTHSREELQKAQMRANVRHWMAERYDRQAFGDNKGPNVVVQVGALHLDALRARAIDERTSQPSEIEIARDARLLGAGGVSDAPVATDTRDIVDAVGKPHAVASQSESTT